MARGNRKKEDRKKNSGANLGFEQQLWAAADALRGSMDAAEYKHVTLGLIFLKYISDASEEYHAKLEAERAQGADAEDPDEYRAKNIFWVPKEARWSQLRANAPARMNLALRGIDGHIAQGDSFHNDRFPDLKADYILANPPFGGRPGVEGRGSGLAIRHHSCGGVDGIGGGGGVRIAPGRQE